MKVVMNLTFVLGVLLIFASCCTQTSKSSTEELAGTSEIYQLVWSDEFDYNGLPDSNKWAFDTEGNDAGWGNNEAQYYTRKNENNAWVENGILHITAIKEDFGGKEFTSARLLSKADWKHGKFEINARLPKATGTWSAIWMMPGNWTFKDGNWPDIGEIDIMEHVGHDLGTIHASAHSKDYQWQEQTQKTGTISVSDVDKEFYTYVLEWTPDMMKVFVGDSLYFEYANEGLGVNKWPYIKPFYLILNVAVGGAWGAMEGIDKGAFPQTMEIDYVRVYQKGD